MKKHNPRSHSTDTYVTNRPQKRQDNTLLVEVAWEVCNQVGGIYTVIRSKAPAMMDRWGDNYCLIGPYVHPTVDAFFEPIDDYSDAFGKAVLRLRERGLEVHYGRWMISGKPKVVLFNPFQVFSYLGDIKYELWDHHGIGTPAHHDLMNQVVAFGHLIKEYLLELANPEVSGDVNLVTHIHEWMAATCIPGIRRATDRVKIVFTTHATLLGRYLAMNDEEFYQHLPFYDWAAEAKKFNVEAETQIERAAAHGSHIFSTVSSVTGMECEKLLGRKPDVIVPNGLNMNRFVAPHEIQNLHQEFKDEINRFIMGHFFHHTPFNLDKTLYFFTSGRFEYKNKGFDITLEALARLNYKMQRANMDTTVVMFFITKGEVQSINPDVLQSRALLEEISETAEAIQHQLGTRLFNSVIENESTQLPNLNDFIDEYWRLRLRRNLQIWRHQGLPSVVTHNLVNDASDPILQFLRASQLINKPEDRVKIVYHPAFINSANPLFGIEYPEFVRGCHLGVFPSYYEPWGYTPLEAMASGVPAVTSNLAGFGDYSLKHIPNPELHGLYVVNRRDLNFQDAAEQLSEQLFRFVTSSRRERIEQRYRVEEAALRFDWNSLTEHYDRAHNMAIEAK
jgi:glycogen(starch) synthase